MWRSSYSSCLSETYDCSTYMYVHVQILIMVHTMLYVNNPGFLPAFYNISNVCSKTSATPPYVSLLSPSLSLPSLSPPPLSLPSPPPLPPLSLCRLWHQSSLTPMNQSVISHISTVSMSSWRNLVASGKTQLALPPRQRTRLTMNLATQWRVQLRQCVSSPRQLPRRPIWWGLLTLAAPRQPQGWSTRHSSPEPTRQSPPPAKTCSTPPPTNNRWRALIRIPLGGL